MGYYNYNLEKQNKKVFCQKFEMTYIQSKSVFQSSLNWSYTTEISIFSIGSHEWTKIFVLWPPNNLKSTIRALTSVQITDGLISRKSVSILKMSKKIIFDKKYFNIGK